MAKNSFYYRVNQKLGKVVQINALVPSQIDKFTKSLTKDLKGDTDHIIEYYLLDIIKTCIPNFKEYFKDEEIENVDEARESEEDDDEFLQIIHILYELIISIYPNFDINTILHGHNCEIQKNIFTKQDIKFETIPTKNVRFDLSLFKKHLKDNITGQEKAIEQVYNAMKVESVGLERGSNMMFLGPTGVGKTLLSRLIGDHVGNFYKINCNEYAGSHEYAKLIGAPPGYIGHNETSILAEKASISSSWVFLFDEIEKAHYKLCDFLLSLLDDGTATDNLGKELDFTGSYFIFTSNIGTTKALARGMNTAFGGVSNESVNEVYMDSVKEQFSAEFLGRMDNIIVFDKLSDSQLIKIAKRELRYYPIKITKKLITYILEHSNTNEYGARNIKKSIKKLISPVLADKILLSTSSIGDPDIKFAPLFEDSVLKFRLLS